MLQMAWFSKLIYFSFVEHLISKFSKYYSEAFSNFSCKCPKIVEALGHLPCGAGMQGSKLCALCSTALLGLHSWQDAVHTHQPLWCRFSLFPSWALPVLFCSSFQQWTKILARSIWMETSGPNAPVKMRVLLFAWDKYMQYYQHQH